MALSAVQRQCLKLFAMFLSAVSGPALASDATSAAGDLWETTSQMSMEGMPMQMPVQRLTRCTAKDWSQPPASENQGDECTTSDFVRDDNTITWTSVCTNGMSGTGEITIDGDTYAGEVRYASSEGEVVIKLTGNRIGECDNPR